MLTTSLATQLRDDLRARPLEQGEIRRITGMGLHFIATVDTDLSAQSLIRIMTLEIDGTGYVLAIPDRQRDSVD
jgi:hypothetical protein